jgi:hypothetical protein
VLHILDKKFILQSQKAKDQQPEIQTQLEQKRMTKQKIL